ncbi:MAG: ABC transporter ATP-binding protein [Verrucomicrobiales bacterium]
MPLLEISDLKLDFATRERRVRVLDGVSLQIAEGETLCLVGESGSGKSVTALSIGRLLPSPPAEYCGGEIRLNGQDILSMDKRELRRIRGGVVSYVFQEPGASLNPVFRIGDQIRESLQLHRPAAANDQEVVRLLKLVGIPAPETRLKDYPHQLSGGMQQRVVIAMALASQPKLLVADEPTTALDVTIQAQILELLARLKAELRMSILLITHTLGIIKEIADRVAVMYAGQIVETGRTNEMFSAPFHPYTRALLQSVPQLGSDNQRLISIPGNVPQLGAFPSGCRFHPRCPQARPDCSVNPPPMIEATPGRWVRCPYWNAPLPEPSLAK